MEETTNKVKEFFADNKDLLIKVGVAILVGTVSAVVVNAALNAYNSNVIDVEMTDTVDMIEE